MEVFDLESKRVGQYFLIHLTLREITNLF